MRWKESYRSLLSKIATTFREGISTGCNVDHVLRECFPYSIVGFYELRSSVSLA